MATEAERTWTENALRARVDALEKKFDALENNTKLTMHHLTERYEEQIAWIKNSVTSLTERYEEQIACLADRVTSLTLQISELQVQIQAQGDAEKATEK